MSDKKIAEYLILKETHPTYVKLLKLFDLADELGISLHYSNQQVIVTDRDRDPKLPDIHLKDIEPHQWIEEFPPTMEYRLIYTNPAWLEAREAEHQARKAEQAKQQEVQRQLERQAERERKARLAQETKERELQLLAQLKEKYEGL